jgi:hypothetical protein
VTPADAVDASLAVPVDAHPAGATSDAARARKD